MLTTSDDGVPVLEPKNVVRRRFVAALGFFSLLGLLLILLMGGGSEDRVLGSGSTLAQPVVELASQAYVARRNADNPLDAAATRAGTDAGATDWVPTSQGLAYEPVGSLGGILRLDDPEVDFAVADYPLTPEALAEKGLVQFPLLVGSVAVVHALGLPAGQTLTLDAATLARIYAMEITRWNDPAIAALNAGVTLPDLAITPVHRTDGSGSTYNLTSWLAAGSPDWAAALGANSLINWPGGTGAERSSGMIAAVRATPGAIGYVETGQATRAGLEVASLSNAAGALTNPSAETMAAAIGSIDWDPAAHFSRSVAAADAPGAYPITAVIYALMRAEPAHPQDTRRALGFLDFLMTGNAEGFAGLGYLPLPGPAVEAVHSYWRQQLDFTS